jgi:ATP-dependent DNA ligase
MAKAPKALPVIAAHPLEQRRVPFDDPDWLFELKADGFRGLLYIAHGAGRFISRSARELRRAASENFTVAPSGRRASQVLRP